MTADLPDSGEPLPPGVRDEMIARRLALLVVGEPRRQRPPIRQENMDSEEAVDWVRSTLRLHRLGPVGRNNSKERRYKDAIRRFEELAEVDFADAVEAAESEVDDWAPAARWIYPVSRQT